MSAKAGIRLSSFLSALPAKLLPDEELPEAGVAVEALAAEDRFELEPVPVDEVVGNDTDEDVTVEIDMDPVPLAVFFLVPEEDVVVEPSFCPVVELLLVVVVALPDEVIGAP
jgi:hypothetical protein